MSADMTKDQIEDRLIELGIEYPSKAKKDELVAILEDAKANGIPHAVTQEDLDASPELAATGVKVGDEIRLPFPAEEGTAPAEQGAAQDAAPAPEGSEVAAEGSDAAQASAQGESGVSEEATGDVTVTLKSPVAYNGKQYATGAEVIMESADAKRLRSMGVAE